LKAVIAERWDAHNVGDDEKKDVKPPLWFRNKVTKELLEGETDDVREEVERRREEGSIEDDVDDDDANEEIDEEESKRRSKARRYQR
jgi:hypothetical protein